MVLNPNDAPQTNVQETARGALQGAGMFPNQPPRIQPQQSAKSASATSKVLPIATTSDGEIALKSALFKARSDLHLALSKQGSAQVARTWVDAYLDAAARKFADKETPLSNMAQIYLHPDYLRAKHPDMRKAGEMVESVAGFFRVLKTHENRALRTFADALLKRFEGEGTAHEQVAISGRALRSLDDALTRLEDPKASSLSLGSLYEQLPSIMSGAFRSIRSATTEGEKARLQETLGKVLAASQGTKLYRSMSRNERNEFDQAVRENERRLESLRLRNGSSGASSKSK